MSAGSLQAQYSLQVYADAGRNYAKGTFFKTAVISTYDVLNYKVRTGFLWTVPAPNQKNMAAWFISGNSAFRIRKARLEAGKLQA